MNTMDSLRAGRSLGRALASYLPWVIGSTGMSRGRARAGDIDIYYKMYGAGDPVVMLHGGFMVCEAWVAQIPQLSREYRVVAMDSRGHGRTNLGTEPLTYRQLGRDTAALIEALDLGPANVIGTSDGGTAALALAIERPELVHSLVLLGTPFSTANYSPEAWRAIHEFLKPHSPALLFMRALRQVMNPEWRTWGSFFERMKEMWLTLPDFTPEELGGITAPALVVGCDHDEFLSRSEDPLVVFRETAEALGDGRLVVVRGGTHTVNLDMPATTTNMILDFYRELPTRFESDFSRAMRPGNGRR